MKIAVDISLYPLDADYVPPIKDFIERLNCHRSWWCRRMHEHAVSGEHARAEVERRDRATFASGGRAVFS